MRPVVSLIYTATVLSGFSHAFNLWGRSKHVERALGLQERASIWGLPDCASTCVTSSFGGCNSIDIECICKNSAFLDNLGCCMSKACSEDDQKAAINFANNFCSAYKVSDLPTAATCASTVEATTATAITSAPGLDPSSPTSLLSALTSAASAALATANATNGTNSVSIRNVTVTVTATSSSTGQAGHVAAEVTGWAWGVGAVLAGAAAAAV